MTSGLIFAFQHMADHPEVFAKVRAEQISVRQGDLDAPITQDLLDQMPYLRAFVKETLRLKREAFFESDGYLINTDAQAPDFEMITAPVIMVPYLAKKPFPIDDNYTCPKGSIVIPSFWNSLHDPSVYTDPDQLIPERWLSGGQAEKSNPQNYLVVSLHRNNVKVLLTWLILHASSNDQFGSGPHKCVAYDYALMHIGAVIGTASVHMDWHHQVTPLSNEIK